MPTNDFGDGIPIPDVIDPPESMEVTICIPKNKDHMVAFWGALYELTIWDSWEQEPMHYGKDLAAVWWRYYLSWDRTMSDIDCEDGMAQCCVEPSVINRINPITGLVETSTNNGGSWSPAPGGFPSVIVQPIPPVTSGVAGTKCDAATNVAGQVDIWIAQVSNDFTTATSLLEFGAAVILAVVTAVLAIISAGTLTALELLFFATVGAGLTAAWNAGKAVFDAYWVTDVTDAILCAAYCHISDDGSYTDAQFSAFWNEINSELPASPAKMLFMGFLSSIGASGLNAMAASGIAADADCASCSCGEECAVTPFIADGENVVIDGCNINVDAHLTGGTYSVYLWFGTHAEVPPVFDASLCGQVGAVIFNTGSASLAGYNDCNTGTGHTSGVPLNTNGSQFFWSSALPFNLSILVQPAV